MAGAPTATQDSLDQWTLLITAAFRQRIRADQLTEALQEQWSKASIPGTVLVSLILTSGAPISSGVDPLIPAYVDEILKVTTVDICDVLIALLSHSRYAIPKAGETVAPKSLQHDLLLQESVFALLLRLLINGERPRAAQESRRAVRALAEWLTACNDHESMLQVQAEGLRAPEPSVISAWETLGTFAISLLTNDTTRNILKSSWPQGKLGANSMHWEICADGILRSERQTCVCLEQFRIATLSMDIISSCGQVANDCKNSSPFQWEA